MPFDGSQLDDVTKLLIEGRERIEQGWCQGRMRERGAVCLVGALDDGLTVPRAYIGAVRRLGRALGFGPDVGIGEIPHWNDVPGRTKAEVLEVYSRAISMSPVLDR